jgi:Intracellular proteinase inhibitor
MAFDALRSRTRSTGFGASAAMLATLLALLVTAPTPRRGPPTVPDSLRFTLIAPESVRTGQPVRITLHLTNVTKHPVEAHFLGREIAFDIVVAGKDGRVVWRRLAHAVVPGILQVKILAPQERLEFSDVWRQEGDDGKRVAQGSYTIWGELPSDDREPRRTETATLRVTP